MTTYATALADRSPEGPRASLLASLTASPPVPLPRALRAALGLPAQQGGRAWLEAWRALGEARAQDEELRAACERAERWKDRGDDGTEQVVEEQVRPGSGSGAVRGDRANAERLSPGGRGREAPPEAAEGGAAPSNERVGDLQTHGGVGRPADRGYHLGELATSRFAEAFAALAPRSEPPDGDEDDGDDAWARVRREAAGLAPGHYGTLLWIDQKCVTAGMHGLDPWWLGTLRAFYESGKLVLVCRVGLRGAKSVSVCRSLVNDALFGRCEIDPGTVAVIPIMSADRTEATDRFHTIKAILAACGVGEKKRKGEDEDFAPLLAPGGLGMTYRSRTLPSGGGVIEVVDCEGRTVEFRIYPARLTGVIGHTDKAGFGDELDTWPVDLGVSAADVAQRSVGGKANPADVVLDRWLERFTTTKRTAHLYLVSASYFGEDTAHARKVKEGDTSIQMVARLGALGAERDTAARLRLAATIGSTDPRLLSPADPRSTDVPAWVTSPAAPIEDCYALSRERLGPMFGRYGGRPDESLETKGPLAGVEIPVQEGAPVAHDVVVGVAPSPGEWGRVAVAMCGDSFTVTNDYAGTVSPLGFSGHASVLACAADQSRAVEAERLAWLAGRPDAYLPPVAPQAIYDGSVLRLAPLRTLFERGRLRLAPGLDTLAAALRAHRDDSDRNPRLEALLAAVMRLVACYPWLGADAAQDYPRTRAPLRGMLEEPTGARMSMAGSWGDVRRSG